MNSRLPPPLPLTAHSPIGQRLAFALESRLRRRRARLDRLELALVHSVAAGTGGTTDWRVRALVDDQRGAAAHVPGAPAAGLRTIDRGELPAGRAIDQLWRWVLDTSLLHRLPDPLLSERVLFSDAAPVATVEVIRHRVLRSAAVLDRLPVSLEVNLGARRVRLSAGFQAREGTSSESGDGASSDGAPDGVQVVIWDSNRRPELVSLLQACARRFDPRSAGPMPPLSAASGDRR